MVYYCYTNISDHENSHVSSHVAEGDKQYIAVAPTDSALLSRTHHSSGHPDISETYIYIYMYIHKYVYIYMYVYIYIYLYYVSEMFSQIDAEIMSRCKLISKDATLDHQYVYPFVR